MKKNSNISGTLITVVDLVDGQYKKTGEIENTFNSVPAVKCMQDEIGTWKMTYPKNKDGAVINCNKASHEIQFGFKKSGR